MFYRLFVTDNFNVEKLPCEEDSSSSSSSTSSDTDIMIMGAFLQHQQQVQQEMATLFQLREATRELTPSASRPLVNKRFIKRDREVVHNYLYTDYFAEDSLYNDHHFCHRFRMQRHLFLCIVDHLEYFHVRYDADGKCGLMLLTKCNV